MKTTTTITRRAAEKIARERFGKKASIRYTPEAHTREQREAAQAERLVLRDRMKEIQARVEAIGNYVPKLVKAARFVVDVTGDPPSIDQLAAILALAEESMSLSQEGADLRHRRDGLCGWSYKWSLCIDLGFATEVRHQADSLEELVALFGPATGAA